MRMRPTIRNASRRGFTLVELLVAAALSILIMAIIASAFQTGLATLSTLKSLGDMAERLKTADTMLRSDLEAEHFETVGSGDNSPGQLRVSDVRFDLGGARPSGGYFQIFQGLPSINTEGNDADGLISTRADGPCNHRLSMTRKKTGRTPDQLFTADLSQLTTLPNPNNDQVNVAGLSISDVGVGTRLVSNWAQVDWFLDTTRMSTINGVNTWPLVRRVRLLGTQPLILNTPIATTNDVLSVNPANRLNTMQTLADVSNRTPAGPIVNPATVGDDIVITNVLSFEVRPVYTGIAYTAGRIDGLFADLPALTNAEFDTARGPGGNNSIRVQAVQVKIRVYDTKNKLTRQTTIVVKL